jgi:hypothetical protein
MVFDAQGVIQLEEFVVIACEGTIFVADAI